VMACSRRDFSSGRLSVTTTGSGNIAAHCPMRSNSSGIVSCPIKEHCCYLTGHRCHHTWPAISLTASLPRAGAVCSSFSNLRQ
jgi:hypothetical protein